MRTNRFALAIAAALAICAGGIVAADAGSGDATAVQLPDDYGVEVTDSENVLSDEDVDRVITTAWGDDEFRDHFEDGAFVHFDVWAPGPNESVHVSAGPSAGAGHDRIHAVVDPDAGIVTEVSEPRTINASAVQRVELDGDEFKVVNATGADGGTVEFDVVDGVTDDEGNGNATAGAAE